MSSTLTIRVPKEVKEKLRKFDVKWSLEIRRFLEERVKQLESLSVMEEISKRSVNRRIEIDSVKLIREDRERR
ncbi:MAG: hypothetical protein QXI59_05600 [Candidatus Bathyarchaeia archaeon]|nr:hypothetical protein [Candidatus Bathyarchaeota archaeon]